MTTSVTNSTSEICLICHAEYNQGEKEDTDKVIELACHHFQHRDCIAPWFVQNETQERDITCAYCNQISMPKRESINLTVECLQAYFCKIEKDPHHGSSPVVRRSLEQLRPLSESILNLINNILNESHQSYETEFRNWLKDNITIELRYMSAKIIGEFLNRGGALKTLREEIKDLSYMPPEDWCRVVPEEGVPVIDYARDGKEFRLKVSKDYFERATKAYIHRKKHNIPNFYTIHDFGRFQESVRGIISTNKGDSEVFSSCNDLANIREDISNLILSNCSLPPEKILSVINEMIMNSELSQISKKTLPLLINQIVFERDALRTLSEQINRWKKEPNEKWPSRFKENGIYVLNEDNSEERYGIKDFEKFVTSARKFEAIYNVGKFEESINTIEACYFYDPEVLESIQDLKNLRKDIVELIESNNLLPIEDIFFLVTKMVMQSDVSAFSKVTIPLLVKEIVFERGALRTMAQEVTRWKQKPIEQWPSQIKETGITFLDKDNSVKHCEAKDFENRVHSQLRMDAISSIVAPTALGIATGFAVKTLLGGRIF